MMKEAATSSSPDFLLNLTAYGIDNIDDWYKTYEAMAQSPDDAILSVSTVARIKFIIANTSPFCEV